MKIFAVGIIKSQLGLICRYYENFFVILLKIKNRSSFRKTIRYYR